MAQKNSGLWAKSWHRSFSGTAHDLGLRRLGGGHETPPPHTAATAVAASAGVSVVERR